MTVATVEFQGVDMSPALAFQITSRRRKKVQEAQIREQRSSLIPERRASPTDLMRRLLHELVARWFPRYRDRGPTSKYILEWKTESLVAIHAKRWRRKLLVDDNICSNSDTWNDLLVDQTSGTCAEGRGFCRELITEVVSTLTLPPSVAITNGHMLQSDF